MKIPSNQRKFISSIWIMVLDQEFETISSCVKPCPIEKWITGQWSSCTATCGNNSYRQRAIGCQFRNKYVAIL